MITKLESKRILYKYLKEVIGVEIPFDLDDSVIVGMFMRLEEMKSPLLPDWATPLVAYSYNWAVQKVLKELEEELIKMRDSEINRTNLKKLIKKLR